MLCVMAPIFFQFLLCSLFLFLLFLFIRFVIQIWWTPLRLQSFFRQQGITGPPYRIFYGNTNEIRNMRKESTSKPMDLLCHNIFPRIHPHVYTWLNTYGKNFVSWHGPRAQFFVTDVDFVKETLNKDGAYLKSDVEGFARKIFGDGLATSKGEKWAKHRKLANHAFHAENLKCMIPKMIASVEMMLEGWKQREGEEIDVFHEFKILTSEIISRTAFGSSYVEGKDIFTMLTQLTILLSRNSNKIKLPGMSLIYKNNDEIEAEKLDRGIYDSFLRIMEKRERKSAMSGEVESFGTDFLGLLMKAKNDADKKNRITVQDVVDECKTFYVAGQETTTNLISWLFFLLGFHTDQEKARQEVLKFFGQEVPTADGLAKLKTVNMIINETLRLYPPAIMLTRKVKEETKLGKLTLPANVQIVVSILALHHDKQTWGDDVLLFKPHRFSQGVVNATNNNAAVFIPFGLGPRGCVGNNFAVNEAKIALAMILQRYSFTLSPSYVHSPVQVMAASPQHGVQILLQPLNG